MTTTKQQIAGFRSESASVNGVSLHYWIGGDPNGHPVLLWHGFLGTVYSWHKLMPLLADAGYSILVPDMRGYGDSDKPAGDAGYDGAALAEEFRSLVGQSLGQGVSPNASCARYGSITGARGNGKGQHVVVGPSSRTGYS
jgi:pimeloyl-ACP methyl ester carboxylesterase